MNPLNHAELRALELVRQVCNQRHMAYSTEKSYCGWVLRFCRFLESYARRDDRSEMKVEAFLTSLARADVSAATQNQAFNALLFFYGQCRGQPLQNIQALRAKRGSHERYCPTVEEVRQLLGLVQDVNGYPTRLLVKLLYGCGMRVNEPVGLRIRDVDLVNSRISVRQSKGAKDRMVILPCSLVDELRRQMDVARVVWQADQANRVPVKLPHLLAKKYPQAQYSWKWAWLFPLRTVSRDRRSGQVVRWHCLDQPIQRAVRAAAVRMDAGGSISPHCLRHAFATHSLQAGQNPRDVQVAMGHAHLDTTMIYLHAELGRMRSPLDAIGQLAGAA